MRFVVLDGRSDADRDRAWSAADIFTSLADNIQETFGLTPVEAMAAGLPVVVSDWDGYKDTVRDGVDGFRVPTLLPPPGTGGDLADQHDTDVIDYDRYVGSTCLLTAVDVEAAADAYAKLIASPDLRRRMGEAGRQRARTTFAWSVIFGRYVSLWEDLAERRRADITVSGEQSRERRPDRPDPFTLFRSYATGTLQDGSLVSLLPGLDVAEAIARRHLKSIDFAPAILPSDETITAVVGRLASEGPATLAELRTLFAERPALDALRAVMVLAKVGVITVRP